MWVKLSKLFNRYGSKSLFFKKQYEIEANIQSFLRYLEDMALIYQEAYPSYFNGLTGLFEEQVQKLSNIEKKMDDLGRQIQIELFTNALMPDSREDVLWLLNTIDQIPSQFKHSLRDISIEKPTIPQSLHELFRQMLSKTTLTIKALVQATDALFTDLRPTRFLAEEVSRQESEVDNVEKLLLQAIFDDDNMELVHKKQLKEIVQYIGRISNLAEDVADAILIFAIKRVI